ncbi:Homeobox protein KNOX3 [Hordeum vulgare]|nr:Homeobox protein KNOX3 [Hordeum vulgare]
MAEQFPGDGAATNGFSRRSLHEWEARVLHEANYPAPPDMRMPGAWRLSLGGVPVLPPPSAVERRGEIACIRASLPEDARHEERNVVDNLPLWMTYFQCRHADKLASTNWFSLPGGVTTPTTVISGGACPSAFSTLSSSTSRAATSRH